MDGYLFCIRLIMYSIGCCFHESIPNVNQTAHLETGRESQNLDSSSDDLAGASDVDWLLGYGSKVESSGEPFVCVSLINLQ